MDKEDCPRSCDDFAFSCIEYDDDGPYIDMEFYEKTNPLEEDDKSETSFEFNISSISAGNSKLHHHDVDSIDDVSPADDLFYKGQLLPLHLPPRLQMVRNLSMSRESQVHKYASPDNNMSFLSSHEDFDFGITFSSGFENGNVTPVISKEAEVNSAKFERTQHMQSAIKSATKFKVSLFGFRKSSKVAMDDHYSTRLSSSPSNPSPATEPKFAIKFKSIKTPVRIFGKNYRTKSLKSPDYSSRSSTGAKHVLQKYLRMMKHTISQRHHRGNVEGQQLEGGDECAWPSNVGESGRRTHISFSGNLKMGFRNLGSRSCPPSMNSSPDHNEVLTSFHDEDLHSSIQGAIAHCKQSNRITGKSLEALFLFFVLNALHTPN